MTNLKFDKDRDRTNTLSNIHSLHTYVCSKVDVFFCYSGYMLVAVEKRSIVGKSNVSPIGLTNWLPIFLAQNRFKPDIYTSEKIRLTRLTYQCRFCRKVVFVCRSLCPKWSLEPVSPSAGNWLFLCVTWNKKRYINFRALFWKI